jgi:hypothetical protein
MFWAAAARKDCDRTTSIAAGSLTTSLLHPNMAIVGQREERCGRGSSHRVRLQAFRAISTPESGKLLLFGTA